MWNSVEITAGQNDEDIILPSMSVGTLDPDTIEIRPNINISFNIMVSDQTVNGTIIQIGEYFPLIEIVNINSIPKLMVRFVDNSNQSQPHGINYIQYDLNLQQI